MNVVVKRVLIAILFIPLILLVLFNGGILLLTFLSLITLFATYELRGMFRNKYAVVPLVIVPLNVIFLLAFALLKENGLLLSGLIISFGICGYDIFTNRIDKAILRTSLSLFIVIYIAYFLAFGYHISMLDGGRYLLVSIIIVIWITDTFAYFLGMALGRHRGLLKASPNKSVEGFIFGFIFAMISSYVLYLIFQNHYSLNQGLCIGLTAGIFGQLGDLIESIIKRDTGVKDSSHIIPGHGGVLDRFDSFIFTLPVFYLLNHLIC